ncbi:MAG: dienelactone hydrolase family protein [Sphingomonadaceae bacterium]|nr:dienelactone hydrolase family protein [Sphingomonadaceae bacterium]
MCDEADLSRFDRLNAAKTGLNRRQFAVLGAAGTLAACTSMDATASSALKESSVSFATPDGTMDGFFVHPGEGKHPAVILWPDIASIRDSKRMMARRLAGEGYAVLLVNPYYRDVAGEQFADFAAFMQSGWDKVKPWRAQLSADAIMRDATAIIGWLDAQETVDTTRGIGNQGYCMGGPFTFWTAAARPARVSAAASFHGGGLVREDAQSPHKTFGEAKAQYLVAIAQNDDAKAPGDKDALRDAAERVGAKAEIEVYPADHGWCVPDSPSYNEAEAERAWARLLALYERAL